MFPFAFLPFLPFVMSSGAVLRSSLVADQASRKSDKFPYVICHSQGNLVSVVPTLVSLNVHYNCFTCDVCGEVLIKNDRTAGSLAVVLDHAKACYSSLRKTSDPVPWDAALVSRRIEAVVDRLGTSLDVHHQEYHRLLGRDYLEHPVDGLKLWREGYTCQICHSKRFCSPSFDSLSQHMVNSHGKEKPVRPHYDVNSAICPIQIWPFSRAGGSSFISVSQNSQMHRHHHDGQFATSEAFSLSSADDKRSTSPPSVDSLLSLFLKPVGMDLVGAVPSIVEDFNPPAANGAPGHAALLDPLPPLFSAGLKRLFIGYFSRDLSFPHARDVLALLPRFQAVVPVLPGKVHRCAFCAAQLVVFLLHCLLPEFLLKFQVETDSPALKDSAGVWMPEPVDCSDPLFPSLYGKLQASLAELCQAFVEPVSAGGSGNGAGFPAFVVEDSLGAPDGGRMSSQDLHLVRLLHVVLSTFFHRAFPFSCDPF